ncbi:hypothetical protein C7Y47_22160 [Lysinibacillus sphaericus]|uniref:Uncharacterized protein n=1 Tax=Lysinibacillus sphaericus TaxID=1421 RepID=A0A544U8C4_LYSSH|nr:hypothetical protein [Lysinibacillus sp. SDF0037]TQR28347.1 hypothetical protein C7Y47_22160 [Lysinibacillus sp. SDF0037]
MLDTKSANSDLYIVANVDENGNVINFPMGGGSSTKASVKAHDTLTKAKRSQRFFKGSVIVKATAFEIVEG